VIKLKMADLKRIGHSGVAVAGVAMVLLVLAALSGCASSDRFGGQPDQAAATPAPPAPPPPSQPPPVDLAGRWRLSVAGGGACLMMLGAAPGAADGTIAPAGGCPGNFYTSRKWTYEHDRLIIRDHKSEVLAELSFAGGRFQGQVPNGGAITLARP
jgi:Protease inhibitor Inh